MQVVVAVDSASSFVSCECIGGTCVTEVVRVVGRVTIELCWAVEKLGGAELVGINGGDGWMIVWLDLMSVTLALKGFDAVLVIEAVKL